MLDKIDNQFNLLRIGILHQFSQLICYKEVPIETNKAFRKKYKCSIFENKPGTRAKPDTYDWRNHATAISHQFIQFDKRDRFADIFLPIYLKYEHPEIKYQDLNELYEEEDVEDYDEYCEAVLFKAILTEKDYSSLYYKVELVIRAVGVLPGFSDLLENICKMAEDAADIPEGKDPALWLNEYVAQMQVDYQEGKIGEPISSTGDEKYELPQPEVQEPDVTVLEELEPKLIETSKTTESLPLPRGARRYLGYIRSQGSFYNFYVVGEVGTNQHFREINAEEARLYYPQHGAIFLVNAYYEDNITRKLIENYFYYLDIEDGDIVPYTMAGGEVREDFAWRIADFHALIREKRFVPMESLNSYFIVYPTSEVADLHGLVEVSFAENGPLDNACNYPKGLQQVVLAYKGTFIGPMPLQQSGFGKLYVQPSKLSKHDEWPCFMGTNLNQAIAHRTIYLHEENAWSPRDILIVDHPSVSRGVYDAMTDGELIRKIASQSKQFTRSALQQLENWIDEEPEAVENQLGVTEEIRAARKARLLRIRDAWQANAENAGALTELINHCSALIGDEKGSLLTRVSERIAADDALMGKLSAYSAIQTSIEQKESLVKLLDKDLKLRQETLLTFEADAKRKADKAFEKRVAEHEKAMAGLQKEIKKAQEELKALNAEKLAQKDELAAFDASIETLGEKLKAKVKTADLAEIAFEPAIAQKFSQAAADWVCQSNDRRLEQRMQLTRQVQPATLTGSGLIQYLLKQTKRFRTYDDNTVLNLYICLAQSFLTVFSGLPGSGKTSICGIMAHVLGMNAVSEHAQTDVNLNRFLPVSVERGWTSKRDFLGYYNPLSKTFETQDPQRYDCFATLDIEAKAGTLTLPYLVLLDEANLSPMEHYWADFMNICDKRDALSHIALGDGKQYRIGDNLRFTATINNDQTTEALSPRLIDRAWIITLPEPDWGGFDDDLTEEPQPMDRAVQILDWQSFMETLAPQKIPAVVLQHKEAIKTILQAVYDGMQRLGYAVSPRSNKAIKRYVGCASQWFKAQEGQTTSYEAAIDYAVAQKLLPCISLVGPQHKDKLEAFLHVLKEHHLVKSAGILQNVIDRGEEAMNMYTFF